MNNLETGFFAELGKVYPEDFLREELIRKCQEKPSSAVGFHALNVVEILRLSSRSRMQSDLRSLGVENASRELRVFTDSQL